MERLGAGRVLRRPLVAGLLLLFVYVALSFVNDPRGTLGADTGIKVATVSMMASHNTLRPDIGYWAAAWDPDATMHGYRDTRHIGSMYVDAPSLPMLVAAYPLWKLGGYQASLFLPMAGAVACAFIARAFASRLGTDEDGWRAFWLLGLASPLVLYALDLWEHTLGVAAMAAGMLLLFDASTRRPAAWRGMLAGACFGLAFTMRTEALVYLATSFAITAVVLARGRQWRGALAVTAAGAVGFLAVAAANTALEVALVGQSIRSSRASGTAGAVGSGLGVRLREAWTTTLSPFPSFEVGYQAAALAFGLALIALAYFGDRRATRRPAALALAAVGVLVVFRLSFGLGFWPGLLATTPFAAVALARGWREPLRTRVLVLALVPLPLVFLFQFPGGALPQWAGRYLLPSGFLLAVVGVSLLPELERWVRFSFVGLALGITAIGLLWMGERTHEVAAAGAQLAARPESVLISPESFPPREFASTYGQKDWLSVVGTDDLPRAVDVVRASGRTTFAIVDQDASLVLPDFPGYHVVGRSEVPFVTPNTFTVTSYAANGS